MGDGSGAVGAAQVSTEVQLDQPPWADDADEIDGTTGADGRLVVTIPDTDEVEIEVESDGGEGEWEHGEDDD